MLCNIDHFVYFEVNYLHKQDFSNSFLVRNILSTRSMCDWIYFLMSAQI